MSYGTGSSILKLFWFFCARAGNAPSVFPVYRPRDSRGAGGAGGGLDFLVQGSLKRGPRDIEFRGENLFLVSAIEVKFAYSNTFFRPNGRPEDTAGHGAGGVKIAGPSDRIEGRTGFAVGEVLVAWVGLVELAGYGVTGKIRGEAADRVSRSRPHGGSFFRRLSFEGGETGAETLAVELRDAEYPDTALGASEPAVQPMAGTSGGIGAGCVYDLDEVLIGCRHGDFF